MNTAMLYTNTALWGFLLWAYERKGSVFAHKARVMLGQNFDCRCYICHPPEQEAPTHS